MGGPGGCLVPLYADRPPSRHNWTRIPVIRQANPAVCQPLDVAAALASPEWIAQMLPRTMPARGESMDKLLQSAAERAVRYLTDLPDRPVAPPPAAVAALDALDLALPDNPTDPHEVLRL